MLENYKDYKEYIDGILLIVSSIILIFSSMFFNRMFKKRTFTPHLQPKNIAFAIWPFIYASLIVSGVSWMNTNQEQITSSIFTLLSCMLCCLWLFKNDVPFLSMFTIIIACIMAACAVLTFTKTKKNELLNILSALSANLLFSWLAVASILATIFYVSKNIKNYRDELKFAVPFLFFHLTVFVTSILRGSGYAGLSIPIPVLWAALCSKNTESVIVFGSLFAAEVSFFLGHYLKCTL